MRESPSVPAAHIVIGVFYETPAGEIARAFGWNGRTREIRYYLDDGLGGRTVSEAEFSAWKIRRDLADFPNARDPRLPYEFDLLWDVKHLSELGALLEAAGPSEAQEIRAAMARHAISLPEGDPAGEARP